MQRAARNVCMMLTSRSAGADDGHAEAHSDDDRLVHDDRGEANDPPSAAESASAVGSLAHTVATTLADGLAHTVAHWKVLLLGQLISFILALAGATNDLLSMECQVSAPSTYNAFAYSLIAIFGGILLRRDTKRERVSMEGDDLAFDEEQESFRGSSHGGGGDDDDDDLTMEDDSPTKRSIFFRSVGSARRRGPSNNPPCNKSHGSESKRRPQYPFMCGIFTIHAKWYWYFAVALLEAQAYYLIFLAFRYTTFTFVYVSDALAIPSAMLFTRLITRRRYRWTHLIGGFICIAGIVVNTASDISIEDGLKHAASSEKIKGDIMAIAGAILMGLDDVLSEILVSEYGGVTEMLFMKGLFAALISVVQMLILERDGLYALFGPDGSSCALDWRMALFATHVATRALDVWGQIQFLFISEAALLNLLLLSADLFAAIFDVVTVGLRLTPYFYGAFSLIVFGIVLYEAAPSPAERRSEGTPLAIEFPQKNRAVHSSTVTEHAGNLSRNDAEFT